MGDAIGTRMCIAANIFLGDEIDVLVVMRIEIRFALFDLLYRRFDCLEKTREIAELRVGAGAGNGAALGVPQDDWR